LNTVFKYFLVIAIAASLITCFIPVVFADIYTYIDSKGIVHFTNVPTSSDYKLYIKEKPKKGLKQSYGSKK